MDFRLSILGTASALPVMNRYPSAHVLSVRGRSFLIDCGEGCQMRMSRMKLSALKIEAVFISHIHGDHIFGFFGLVTTMGMLGRTAPLHVYAPRSFAPILKFTLSYFGEGMKFPIEMHVVKVSSPEPVFDAKSFEVYAFPLRHRIETYGYLFKEKEPLLNVRKELIEPHALTLTEIGALKQGRAVTRENGDILDPETFTYRPFVPRSYAYCSDTAPFPELSEWVKGVTLLFHEATYTSGLKELAEATNHSTASDAALCAAEAGAGRLLLGHYSSRYKDLEPFLEEAQKVFPDTLLAKDGDIIEIPLEKF
ncbi:MAG: ribonuclease Z [Bacteroidetes bacterium]|uniref:Ribonuclease Z n=1 Tax=Candidatus Merdivivens pullicola TaxID=2840872 RepID=A0A9D9IGT4_9BACT|nr:ribonuclease Z [Candidatus Merdivivens pullicola]